MRRCRLPALDRRLPRHCRAKRHLRHDLRPRLPRRDDLDPEVLEKARYQPEFTAPVWDYFDNRVHDQSVAVGREMAQKWKPLARPDRGQLRRRPQHPARHLVDGIELRRDPQERQGHAQCRALAGDACLCRPEARQIRPHPADRGAEDPAERRHRRKPPDRLLGRRHGPHPVHPDQLPALCRRHGRQRQARHLELGSRRAGDRRQPAEEERLADRARPGATRSALPAGRQVPGRLEDARRMAGARRRPRQAASRSATAPTRPS